MYCILQSLKSIDVKYGSKYHVPNKTIIPVFTNSNDMLKSIYVSSPKLNLPWHKSFCDDESMVNIEFANENNQFTKRLKEFCLKTIKGKIESSFEIDLHQIKVYANDAHTLRFYNVKVKDISIYDETGRSISINDINRDDYVKILFHLNAIVIKGTKVQFDMKLIQVMKLIPYVQVNKTMSLLSGPKPNPTTPPPPPPPPPRHTQHKQKMVSSLSVISKDELLDAMSRLKKTH